VIKDSAIEFSNLLNMLSSYVVIVYSYSFFVLPYETAIIPKKQVINKSMYNS
jgi:hypothetical protein